MVDAVKGLFKFLFGLFTQGTGAGDLGSPIGIVTQTVDAVQEYDARIFIDIALFLSVNLGLFNLLPIPGLDGAKVVFLAIEGIRRKPVPQKAEGLITAVGFGFFILLFIVLAGRDIFRIFGLVT
jgi:regulator of sigma E protease